jgi:hypothetical protein
MRLRADVVAMLLTVSTAGCSLSTEEGDSGPVDTDLPATDVETPVCEGFPEVPADCANVLYVCPGAFGSGNSPADPAPMPEMMEISADRCLLLAQGHYQELPLTTDGIRAFGGDPEGVVIEGGGILAGSEYGLGWGATIELAHMTFRKHALMAMQSTDVRLTDLRFQNAEVVVGECGTVGVTDVTLSGGSYPLSVTECTRAILDRVSVRNASLDADQFSIALSVGNVSHVTATDVEVSDNAGIGLATVDSRAEMSRGTLKGNGYSGLAMICTGVSTCALGKSTVSDTAVTGNLGYGVVVSGGWTSFSGLTVSGTKGAQIAPGTAFIARKSADVALTASSIVDNGHIGVVVDHSLAVLTDVVVSRNAHQGIWIQSGLSKEGRDWSVEILGDGTEVCGNGIVGLGVFQAGQIHLKGGRYCDTRLVELPSGGADVAGDGIAFLGGLAAGTGVFSVLVEDVLLSGNGRAQLLLDQVDGAMGVGIRVTGTKVEAKGNEQYGWVSQRAVQPPKEVQVDVPASLTNDPGSILPVCEDPEPIPDLDDPKLGG